MDVTNKRILKVLQQDARKSFTNIGKIVGLTSTAVAERVKKMEDAGVIEGYQTKVSFYQMGYQIRAMITMKAFSGKLKPFLAKVTQFEEVVSCYRITGNENIIMEVILRDHKHLESFIDQLITYGETKTHIILSEVQS